jgi:hypothetical protein
VLSAVEGRSSLDEVLRVTHNEDCEDDQNARNTAAKGKASAGSWAAATRPRRRRPRRARPARRRSRSTPAAQPGPYAGPRTAARQTAGQGGRVKFAYQAVDASGKVVNGTVDAADQHEAMDALRRQGLFVGDVHPPRPVRWATPAPAATASASAAAGG